MTNSAGESPGDGPEIAEQASNGASLSSVEIAQRESCNSHLGRAWAWLLLLSMGVVWGLTFSLAKIAAEGGGHPIGINYWMSLIGAVILGMLSLVTRQKTSPQAGQHSVLCRLRSIGIDRSRRSVFLRRIPGIARGLVHHGSNSPAHDVHSGGASRR